MSKINFTDEFKLGAVKQATERGYSVADVSRRLWYESPFTLQLDEAL